MGKRTRDVLLRFFVTAEEKAALQKRMELVGLTNMSTFLRKIALDGYSLSYSNYKNNKKTISHKVLSIIILQQELLSIQHLIIIIFLQTFHIL